MTRRPNAKDALSSLFIFKKNIVDLRSYHKFNIMYLQIYHDVKRLVYC